MLDGVMLLWFILTALSVLFVSIDILKTPEATVLRWSFVILTLFTGPIGAFFYVLGCREPLPGTHEQYVSATWRQVLGSTMHCAAGDGLGIIAGAVVGSVLSLSTAGDIGLEYFLGFAFGWTFFQAFAMRDMAGGDYLKSLKMTFVPEFLSMNLLMAGMILVSKFWMPLVEGAASPSSPAFWFIMSISLLAGFLCAYPINWWLVTRGLKHGMMTIRPKAAMDMSSMDMGDEHEEHQQDMKTMQPKAAMDMSSMDMGDEHEEHQQDMKTMQPKAAMDMSSMDMGDEHEEHQQAPGKTATSFSVFMVGSGSVLALAITVAAVLLYA